MMNFSEISIEVEQDLYDEVSVLCCNAGTSVEALTAAFFELCIIPENLPSLEVFLGKEKAASEEAERLHRGLQSLLMKQYPEQNNCPPILGWSDLSRRLAVL